MGRRVIACRTCMNVCDKKVTVCENYHGFRQLSLFPQKTERLSAPRETWEDYGITKQRYRELSEMARSKRYASIASPAAHRASEMIAPYILLSVTKKRSYEAVEYADGLGRIPCGRTDFYGYRRYFYHLFDLEIRRIESEQGNFNREADGGPENQ